MLKILILSFIKISDLFAQDRDIVYVKKMLNRCSEIVNRDSNDVKNRNLSDRINASMGTCNREKVLGSEAKSLLFLAKDVEKIADEINFIPIASEANQISLRKSVLSFWVSHKQLVSGVPLDEESALSLVCSANTTLCSSPIIKAQLRTIFKSSSEEINKIIFFNTKIQDQALIHFNQSLLRMNNICLATLKDYKENISLINKRELDKVKINQFNNSAVSDATNVARPDYKKIYLNQKLFQASFSIIEDEFKNLLSAPMGHLMMAKSLQAQVGNFNSESIHQSCLSGRRPLFQLATKNLFEQAKKEFINLTTDEMKSIQKNLAKKGSYSNKDTLKTYLQNNPSTIAELLKNHPTKEYGEAMCSLIRDINEIDELHLMVNQGVMAVGAISSVALTATGIGAPLGGLLFATVTGSTLIGIGTSTNDYFNARVDEIRNYQAGATKQSALYDALKEGEKNKKFAKENLDNIQFLILTEAAGAGAGKIIQSITKVKKISPLIKDINLNASDELPTIANSIPITVKKANSVKLINDPIELVEDVSDTSALRKLAKENPYKSEVTVGESKAGANTAKLENYHSFIKESNVDLNREVLQNRSSCTERLAQMTKNSNPKDTKYLMDSGKLKPNFAGGEADIYVNPFNNQEALKIWKPSRMDDFELSTKAMLLYEKRITKTKKLNELMNVSRIKEKGTNYIVKEFIPNSVELKYVIQKPSVQIAIKKIKKQLLTSPDIIDQKILQAISRNPPSANFHWDPDQKKIILIDALGF